MNQVSSRLAARLGIRQVDAHFRARRAAHLADAAVLAVWDEILALLERPRLDPFTANNQATAIFSRLPSSVLIAVGNHLEKTAAWGHRTAAGVLAETIPERLLRYAAARQVTEGRDGRFSGGGIPVSLEEVGRNAVALVESLPTVADLLFPRFSDWLISRIVYASGWWQRLAAATRLTTPLFTANIVSGGLAAGFSPQKIAQLLAPAVNNVRSTARRVARTETMRVAQASQMECHKQLGDLVIGYQVHATLDQHTRPWHASRSGTVYYLNPKPGQKGPQQQPNPPDEPADVRERPIGAPATAWNCRCWLSPVLKDPHVADIPAAVVPDPLVYGTWFDRADVGRRRVAVGVKRYNLMRDRLDREPRWADFLDPETGDLVPFQSLKAETEMERTGRVVAVAMDLAKRKAALAATSMAGYLPGT